MNFKVLYAVMASLLVTEIAAKGVAVAAPETDKSKQGVAPAAAGKGEELEGAADTSQKYRPYAKSSDGASAGFVAFGSDSKSGSGKGGYKGVVAVATSGGDRQVKQLDKADDKKKEVEEGSADVGGGYYVGDDGAASYAYASDPAVYPGDGGYVQLRGGAPGGYAGYQAAASAPNVYLDYVGVYPGPVDGVVPPGYAQPVPAASAQYPVYLAGQYPASAGTIYVTPQGVPYQYGVAPSM